MTFTSHLILPVFGTSQPYPRKNNAFARLISLNSTPRKRNKNLFIRLLFSSLPVLYIIRNNSV